MIQFSQMYFCHLVPKFNFSSEGRCNSKSDPRCQEAFFFQQPICQQTEERSKQIFVFQLHSSKNISNKFDPYYLEKHLFHSNASISKLEECPISAIFCFDALLIQKQSVHDEVPIYSVNSLCSRRLWQVTAQVFSHSQGWAPVTQQLTI